MTTAKRAPSRPAPKTATPKAGTTAETAPSQVDQMAEDAVPEEYPDGTPEFLIPLAIRPRSRRGEFKRRYALVIDKYTKLAELKSVVEADEDPPPAEQMRIMAEMDDVYQAIDDVLRLAAVNPDEYAAWSDGLENDDELMKVFSVYQRRSQPGEASSSTS